MADRMKAIEVEIAELETKAKGEGEPVIRHD